MTIIRKQWRLKWFSMNGFFIESVCVQVSERRAHLLNVSDDQIPEIRIFSVEIMKYLERNCTKACNVLTKNTKKGLAMAWQPQDVGQTFYISECVFIYHKMPKYTLTCSAHHSLLNFESIYIAVNLPIIFMGR